MKEKQNDEQGLPVNLFQYITATFFIGKEYHLLFIQKAYTFPPKSETNNVFPEKETELNIGEPK